MDYATYWSLIARALNNDNASVEAVAATLIWEHCYCKGVEAQDVVRITRETHARMCASLETEGRA